MQSRSNLQENSERMLRENKASGGLLVHSNNTETFNWDFYRLSFG